MKKIYAVSLILIIILSLWSLSLGGNSEFNFNEWNNHYEDRYKMIPSLIDNYNLIGMHRDDVINLLGTNGLYTNNDVALEYYVAKGLGDPMFFGIYFDTNGFVINYKTFES